ncbi:MAG: serine O-acetyltransferase EpsC [Verrucomicrobiota bacterium]
MPTPDPSSERASKAHELWDLSRPCGTRPSRRAVHEFCDQLLEAVFQGYFGMTAEELTEWMSILSEELPKAFCAAGHELGVASEKANQVLAAMDRRFPELRQALQWDVEAAYEGDPAAPNLAEIIFAYPAIETIAIQRFAHVLYQEGVPLIPRIMTEWAHSRTGIDIHPGATIGKHFFIDHGTGVVIGETTVIGDWVKLYQGVTLGALSFKKDTEGRLVKGIKRHPNVEDDVTIYANATILGGETVIGRGSTIGASVFLMESVPPDSIVAIDQEESQRQFVKRKRSTTS